MKYRKTITLKDGRICILRNGTEKDGRAVLDNFNLIALCKSCHGAIHAKRGDYWGRTMSSGHRSYADRSGDPSRVGAVRISTGMAPRERCGGHACKIAK